jgi:hypothetical protein
VGDFQTVGGQFARETQAERGGRTPPAGWNSRARERKDPKQNDLAGVRGWVNAPRIAPLRPVKQRSLLKSHYTSMNDVEKS